RRHTRWPRDWSSDVCSSDLTRLARVLSFTLGFPIHVLALSLNAKTRANRVEVAAPASECDIATRIRADVDSQKLEARRFSAPVRSEERRVGKECRSRWAADT